MADKNWLNELERLNRIAREDFQTAEVPFEESAMGKLLADLEKQTQQQIQQVADLKAQQKEQHAAEIAQRLLDRAEVVQRHQKERRDAWVRDLVVAAVGALLALFVEHWHSIAAFVVGLFH